MGKQTQQTGAGHALELIEEIRGGMQQALAAERHQEEDVVERLEQAWARIEAAAFEEAKKYTELLRLLDPQTEPGMLPVHLLGVIRQPHIERHHTSAILVLMNPKDPSGLGSELLKALLDLCAPRLSASREDLLGAQISEPRWTKDADPDKMPDLVIEVPGRNPKTVVVIENKILDVDRKDQLDEYAARARRRYRGVEIRRMYLTPEGDSPTAAKRKSEWQCMSYRDLLCAWRKVLAIRDRKAKEDGQGLDARSWALRLYLATVLQHTLATTLSDDLPYVRRTRVIPYLKAALGGDP